MITDQQLSDLLIFALDFKLADDEYKKQLANKEEYTKLLTDAAAARQKALEAAKAYITSIGY